MENRNINSKAINNMENFAHQARTKAEEITELAVESAKKYPLHTAATVGAVSLVVGFLLGRQK